jgi:hypothetical protein
MSPGGQNRVSLDNGAGLVLLAASAIRPLSGCLRTGNGGAKNRLEHVSPS